MFSSEMAQRSKFQYLRSEYRLTTVCLCVLRCWCCCVRCELWPCGALGNTCDCLSQLLWWCCNQLDLARVCLSCEPLFSIIPLPWTPGHVCVPVCVILCVCVCLLVRVCVRESAVGGGSLQKGQTCQRSPLTRGQWNLVFTKRTQDA